MYDMGVVIFNDTDTYLDGVAYSRSTMLVRVKSLDDLDSNITWLSNIPSDRILPEYIKPNDFFGLSFDSIIYRLGLHYQNINKVVKEIYFLYEKTLLKLIDSYHIDITSSRIADDIYNKLNYKSYNLNDKQVLNKIGGQNLVEVTRENHDQNKRNIYLNAARYNYIKNICKTKIPIGNWIQLKGSEIRSKIEGDSDYFKKIGKNYNYIASVKISVLDKDLDAVLPNRYTQGKVWITNSEYIFLKGYCDIYIDDIYISKKSIHLEEIESTRLFKIDDYEESYLSNYIAAYNYLSAFKIGDNILSNWLIVEDKLNMLKMSYVFKKLGIDVISYGEGSLLVSCEKNKDDLIKVVKISKRLNLNYPMELVALI